VTQTLDQEVLQFSSRADAGEILAGPLRVAELMTSETTSMSADQTFGELVTMMANRSFHHVLVVEETKTYAELFRIETCCAYWRARHNGTVNN
jgi:hypothetical protein